MAGWRCATCDEEHDEPPRDFGAGMPDEVFALETSERERRAKVDSDRCVLDGSRWFVRCVLDIPTPDHVDEDGDARVSLGLWAEIAGRDFEPITTFGEHGEDAEKAERPVCRGRVANAVRGVPDLMGLEVLVRPTSAKLRPKLHVVDESATLARWQAAGIPWDEWMRIVAKNIRSWAAHVFRERSARYEFGLEPSAESECGDCGEKTTRLVRFVSFDGEALAVYYARFTAAHETKAVYVLLSIGEFGEGADPTTRAAFSLELRDDGTRALDATDGSWRVPETFGRALTRDEALAHPAIDTVFEITDVARDRDEVIAAYLGG
jgi:hypothetical protein